MEIRTPHWKRAVIQVDYGKDFAFLNSFGGIAQDLLNEFQDWKNFKLHPGGMGCLLVDEDRHRWLFLELGHIRIMWDNLSELKEFAERADAILSRALSRIRPKTIARIGSRNSFLTGVSKSDFQELHSLMVDGLLSESFRGVLPMTGQETRDIGIVLDFQSRGRRCHLEIGPLTRDEVKKRFDVLKDDDAPKLSLLVDVDFAAVRSESEEMPEIQQVLEQSHTNGLKLAHAIIEILKKGRPNV